MIIAAIFGSISDSSQHIITIILANIKNETDQIKFRAKGIWLISNIIISHFAYLRQDIWKLTFCFFHNYLFSASKTFLISPATYFQHQNILINRRQEPASVKWWNWHIIIIPPSKITIHLAETPLIFCIVLAHIIVKIRINSGKEWRC